MSSGTSKSSKAALLAALPPLVLVAFLLAVVLGVGDVRADVWPAPTTNLSEAAALRDLSRIRLLTDRGADVNAVYTVEPDVLGRAEVQVTPLVAAAATNVNETVELLLELGAKPQAEDARLVHCLAARANNPDMSTALEKASGLAPSSCDGLDHPLYAHD
jgi:hypothetical protein